VCKTCERIRSILDASDMASAALEALRNNPDELAAELLSATPAGRAVKATRTGVRVATPVARKVVQSKAGRAASKRLSKALAQVNSKARLKSGKIRKGWSQSRIMKEAHKIAKKGGIR